ncbi:MAG: FixH family protein [Halieaceae bacterium]|nr:FixH family protein [Halieaceae bacterium]
MNDFADTTPPPWYRQFWPWFLFGLPGIVVVAGLTTWWIAANNADSLVAEDYYKEGLAINQELSKQRLAEQLGVAAVIEASGDSVEVTLDSEVLPAALELELSHPLDAESDIELRLAQITPGIYRAPADLSASPRWLWQLEPIVSDADRRWQLLGELRLRDVEAN